VNPLTNLAVAFETQAALEQRMLEKGVTRYIDIQERAANEGDLTKAQDSLFQGAFGKVLTAVNISHLEESLKTWPAYPAPHAKAMTDVDHQLLAAIALKHCFNGAANEMDLTTLAVHVGVDVEIEMAATAVRNNDKEAFDKIAKRRCQTVKAREQQAKDLLAAKGELVMEIEEHLVIGLQLINMVLNSTNLFNVQMAAAANDEFVVQFNEEGYRTLHFTDEALQRMETTKEIQQWMHPVYQPMVVRPVPWSSFNTGAYTDQRVAKTVPLSTVTHKEIKAQIDQAAQNDVPFVQALNAIQDVPLRINERVLQALVYVFDNGIPVGKVPGFKKPIPEGADKETKRNIRKDNDKIRAKRLAVQAAINEAVIYVGKDFYQPHQLDWRGRVYAKPGFNHQRADFCKGLYDLARGEVLTEEGVYWLKWHIATTGAFKVNGVPVDKMPEADRVAWTDARLDNIMEIAQDPIGQLHNWSDADSPFCFLAACFALYDYFRDNTSLCHIPVAIDGSCSGLQHFSALLRDSHGGSFVNLVPGEKPADVYAEVASIVFPLVQADASGDDEEAARFARMWLAYGIDRKVAKRATMTFVYGSKQSGFADQLLEDIVDTDKGRPIFGDTWELQKPACLYLAKHINTAVRQTVRAASDAMKFLQDIAGILAKENLPVAWTTCMGLPVVNAYYKPNVKQVKSVLWNRALNIPVRFDPTLITGFSRDLLVHKQRNGIAPNFVHSLDSAHLMSVVLASKEAGINDFLLIHDSFACLPSQMGRFGRIVRETFVNMYTNNEPLQEVFDNAVGALMKKAAESQNAATLKGIERSLKALRKLSLPVKGTLDLAQIIDSKYAFA